MSKFSPDSTWMPPREEWDFRSLTEEECRMACCWEYARSLPSVGCAFDSWFKEYDGRTSLSWYINHGGPNFPDPWMSFSNGQPPNSEVFNPKYLNATGVFSMREEKKRLKESFDAERQAGRDPWKVVDEFFLDDGYFLIAGFAMYGTETIIEELETWARIEGRKFRSPRAKAAAPPFDCFKWLATYRLEAARKKAGVGFDAVQRALRDHLKRVPVADGVPVLPIYASPGAWSKAKSDAHKLLNLLRTDPIAFERRVIAIF